MDNMQLTADLRGDKARISLINAGLLLFGEYGFKATTIRMLAKEANVNIAAIPYYFGSKNGLYMAVIEHIVTQMQGYIGKRFAPITQSLQEKTMTKEATGKAVQIILRTMAEIFVEKEEVRSFALVIIREQVKPTKGFDVLHDSMMGKVHHLLSQLIQIACKLDRNAAIIKTHMLVGQVLVFVASRELLLRQLGVTTLKKQHFSLIYNQLNQHVALCLSTSEEL